LDAGWDLDDARTKTDNWHEKYNSEWQLSSLDWVWRTNPSMRSKHRADTQTRLRYQQPTHTHSWLLSVLADAVRPVLSYNPARGIVRFSGYGTMGRTRAEGLDLSW